MLYKTLSAAVYGIDANIIQVEVDCSGIKTDQDHFHTVGLPDAAVRESRDRVRAALKNCGYDIPPTHITINLAPADLKDRPGRHGAQPAGDRPGIVVGTAQRRRGGRVRDLELAHARDGVDRRGDSGQVSAGIGQRGPRGVGGQVDRGPAPVPGLIQAL